MVTTHQAQGSADGVDPKRIKIFLPFFGFEFRHKPDEWYNFPA
jgi:hypothetical protein